MAGKAETVRFYAHWMRRTGSPRAAADHVRAWQKIDLHSLLSTVQVPVLVLDRGGDAEEGAYVASLLPKGRFRMLEGEDFIPYYNGGQVVAAIRDFVDETSESGQV
jgi:hypothetical protein